MPSGLAWDALLQSGTTATARPACRGALNLHGKADDLEAVRRQLLEIVQLFQVRVADLTPGAMAFPDQARITRRGHLPTGVGKRRIPAPPVGADQAHAPLQHPQGRGLAHAAARVDVVVL